MLNQLGLLKALSFSPSLNPSSEALQTGIVNAIMCDDSLLVRIGVSRDICRGSSSSARHSNERGAVNSCLP